MDSDARETFDRATGSVDTAAPSRAEEAFASWVAERESGTLPDLDSFLGELDDLERSAFRELLSELQDAEATLDGPVRPGVVLEGRLEIQRELGEGQGGMGKVFAAFDRKLERPVAVKVLRDHSGGPLDGEGQLRAEALALARLNHPSIVAVHDVLTLDGATCLVMDEVQGVPLADVLEQVRRKVRAAGGRPRRASLITEAIGLPTPVGLVPLFGEDDRWWDAVARIALVVCRSLEAAHGAGVLHRDLKPRNVMLRGGGSPVVLDFGLAHARASGRTEAHGRLRGSAAYLAPEQIAQEKLGDDPRSDVYQVGLLLYEMLVLRPAFTGKQLSAVLRHILRGELRTPRTVDKGIPFELEAICLKAMERHPDRRYASVTELAADLLRFVDGTGLPHAARGGVVGSTLRGARYALRRRRNSLLAAAAAVFVGLGAAWFLRPVAALPPERLAWYAVDSANDKWLTQPSVVRSGDMLGFTIECDGPRWVYVLSAFGEPSPPTWVAPLPALTPEMDPEAPRERWGLLVDAGVTNIDCAWASQAAPDIPFEGLWVFVGREENEDIERWMDELWELQDDGREEGVAYAQARSALERLQEEALDRGKAILDDDDKLKRARATLAASALLDEDWPYAEPRRYTTFMRLEP